MAPPAPVQRAYGLSLAGYIRAQKLQKSVERLTRSDEPILNVAIALGFDSQQSFNRSFKRQYGQAPGHGGGVWVARKRSSFASNAYFAATSICSCYTVYKWVFPDHGGKAQNAIFSFPVEHHPQFKSAPGFGILAFILSSLILLLSASAFPFETLCRIAFRIPQPFSYRFRGIFHRERHC
jgi:hypothetical protein